MMPGNSRMTYKGIKSYYWSHAPATFTQSTSLGSWENIASIQVAVSCLQGYIFWPFPPWEGGGEFLFKLKNREEFEGGLEKRKGKEEKEEKSDKTHVKTPL